MKIQWLKAISIGFLAMNPAFGQPPPSLDFHGTAPEGLVGNGQSIVKVQPAGFEFYEGGHASGRFRLFVDGRPVELQNTAVNSSFFPGGVAYRLVVDGMEVNILHGATAEFAYVAAVRVKHAKGRIEFENEGADATVSPVGRTGVPLQDGEGFVVISTGGLKPQGTWDELRARFEAPYYEGFWLETPDVAVDRAVPFNRFLLNLAFNGHLHVCELFRWRDVWSRDLGSGLVPGALADGDFFAARTTLEYDLHRYATTNPGGLKVTEDPSQGGSAEGTAWLTRAVWRYYLLSADDEFLRRAATILRPWVNAWIDRDADDRGLLIDVTEWMDHSRFFLFPDGARVLYSNAMFVELLRTFTKIETTLGNDTAAQRFESLRMRFIRTINTVLWNERTGEYDNLTLWGRADERSSSDGNILAVLSGVAPADRVQRVLATIRAANWRSAGSVTITPPMTHVDAHNDHNYKVWPWWNAVEARARFLNGDIDGGIHLLESFSKTLADEHYPGLVEELLTPDGVSEGGHAFTSAAGAYQDAIFEGLLGIEILEPGCVRIRVSPNVPLAWKSWRATIPLPQGKLQLVQSDGRLHIVVTDPRVKTIEAPVNATVSGARRAALSPRAFPVVTESSESTPRSAPALRERKAALFLENGIPSETFRGLPRRRVSADELLTLDPANVEALVIAGNALPRRTKGGIDIQPPLARYLDRGGAIVFYGATMHDRSIMGEHSGVVDWYEFRPKISYTPITGWKFRNSPSDGEVEHQLEDGFKQGWHHAASRDPEWSDAHVSEVWDDHPSTQWRGWEWYRADFQLPIQGRGKSIVLTLGKINSMDWTYVNGVLIGSSRGDRQFRNYWIKPGDAAYGLLKFGGKNSVAVQVQYAGVGGGLYADVPTVGIESDQLAWVALDAQTAESREYPERHGVVSWGPGAFFNSWETSRGAFGFRIDGQGVQFAGPLADMPTMQLEAHEAFSDFAIRKPWLFQPLAYTNTHKNLLYPDHGESYPNAARIVNTQTGGEWVLISASIARALGAAEVLKRLDIHE